MYLVCRIIKAIFSVVVAEAAIIRSPSFSREVESRTIMNSPLPFLPQGGDEEIKDQSRVKSLYEETGNLKGGRIQKIRKRKEGKALRNASIVSCIESNWRVVLPLASCMTPLVRTPFVCCNCI